MNGPDSPKWFHIPKMSMKMQAALPYKPTPKIIDGSYMSPSWPAKGAPKAYVNMKPASILPSTIFDSPNLIMTCAARFRHIASEFTQETTHRHDSWKRRV